MSDWTPSPELVEACAAAFPTYGTDEDCVLECLPAAVAYRTPDNTPELVQWERVRELVEAAQEMLAVWGEVHDEDSYVNEYADGADDRLRAALAPFTQEPA